MGGAAQAGAARGDYNGAAEAARQAARVLGFSTLAEALKLGGGLEACLASLRGGGNHHGAGGGAGGGSVAGGSEFQHRRAARVAAAAAVKERTDAEAAREAAAVPPAPLAPHPAEDE